MTSKSSFQFGRLLSGIVVLAFSIALSVMGSDQARAEDVGDWLAKSFGQKSVQSGKSSTVSRNKSSGYSRLGGPSSESPRRSKSQGVRVASLGNSYVPKPTPRKSLSGGGGINWVANSGCLSSNLRGVIASVAANYGSVTVSSTCRSRSHNARVGGASKSHHLTGDAADFRVHGNWGAAAGFIRSHGGGYKHYGGGLFHIDNGARRTW